MKNRNHNYFDKIDTEYKAYILGFIFADGTIELAKGNRMKRLRISVQIEDGYILDKLGKDVGNKKTVVRYPPSSVKNSWKKQLSLSISSDILCDRLIELGCAPRKSIVGMDFPKLPTKMVRHFIRGFFDGDGSIVINKYIYKGKYKSRVFRRKRIALCSTSQQFLEDLIKELPISKIYKTVRVRNLSVHIYWIERKADIVEMNNYFYKDSEFFLQRKKDKFSMSTKSQALGTPKEGLETT